MQKPRLSRGLKDLGVDQLLSDLNTSVAVAENHTPQNSALQTLPVDLIHAGSCQPRKDFDPEALQELANSIRQQGIIQPIVVRSAAGNEYEIIAGERRWRAAQLAGLQDIPAIIRDDITEDAAMAFALIENVQREDLNPIEEAVALDRLINEYHITHEQVAENIGKSRSAVTNLLRLLKLNDDVRIMVERGDLSMGHAKVMLALAGLAQTDVARMVVAKELSVRETERLVQNRLSPKNTHAKKKMDPDIARFQSELSAKLGAKVAIQHGNKGKGKLTIHYSSSEELEGILHHLT